MPTISRQEHAALFGPTVGDKIRLGDTDLFVEIEKDQMCIRDRDKEAGLDLTMLRFASGKAIVEGVLAYDWAIAGCGAVPALTATLSERLDIIAVANDESAANALYVRADSPLLSIKGTNPAYPDIYGDQATVKGCLLYTSTHCS